MTRFLKGVRQRLEGADLVMLIASAVMLLGAWCFVEIADQMRDGDTDSFDAWVLRSFRRPEDPGELRGPWWMGEVVRVRPRWGARFCWG